MQVNTKQSEGISIKKKSFTPSSSSIRGFEWSICLCKSKHFHQLLGNRNQQIDIEGLLCGGHQNTGNVYSVKTCQQWAMRGEKFKVSGLQVVYPLSPGASLSLFEQAFCDILGWRSVWKENSKQEVINGLINLLVFIEPLLSAHHGDCKDDDTEFLNLCF